MRTMNHSDPLLIQSLCESFQNNTHIERGYYAKYGVKNGLRNADGTGVLVGLTNVSSVHGYIVNEGERQPIEGHLTYRGYDLFDLLDGFASEDRFGYAEVAYLLISGKLPSEEQLSHFKHIIGEARHLPENFTEDMIMRAPSKDLMNKLAGATLALYSYDPNPDDTSLPNLMRQSMELLAKFPVIISHAYQAKRRYYDHASMYLHQPLSDKSTAENILRLIRPDRQYTQEEARLLDRCLIIHADHGGGNNSAFTTRAVSSSGSDTYSAIAAAVGSLKGPRHGGANLRVMQMYDDMMEKVSDTTNEREVYDYLIRVLRKEENDHSGLIYGMGHAVYTYSDPRTVSLKATAMPLAKQTGFEEEFALREMVERLAPQAYAEVKGEEKIMCANVDMYSGLVYQMLRIPTEMYTPLFATARIAGWLAHRLEEATAGGKIMRPAYKSITKNKTYVKLANR